MVRFSGECVSKVMCARAIPLSPSASALSVYCLLYSSGTAVDHVNPSGPSRPATGSPSSLIMLTVPSTPSPAVTVTGDSTETPTAPSVTDVCNLGTNRSPYGVPLSLITCGAGDTVVALQALRPTMAAAINATVPSNERLVFTTSSPSANYYLRTNIVDQTWVPLGGIITHMKLNAIERAAMNNPIRAVHQHHREAEWFRTLAGGSLTGQRVLEVGCGRGVGSQVILDRLGAAEVTAFDLDESMVELARKRLQGRPVSLSVGDVCEIHQPADSMDTVVD